MHNMQQGFGDAAGFRRHNRVGREQPRGRRSCGAWRSRRTPRDGIAVSRTRSDATDVNSKHPPRRRVVLSQTLHPHGEQECCGSAEVSGGREVGTPGRKRISRTVSLQAVHRLESWWRLIHRRAPRSRARAIRLMGLVTTPRKTANLTKLEDALKTWEEHQETRERVSRDLFGRRQGGHHSSVAPVRRARLRSSDHWRRGEGQRTRRARMHRRYEQSRHDVRIGGPYRQISESSVDIGRPAPVCYRGRSRKGTRTSERCR